MAYNMHKKYNNFDEIFRMDHDEILQRLCTVHGRSTVCGRSVIKPTQKTK